MSVDQEYISLYRAMIEKKFMMGNGQGKLKQREIEYLSTLIEEKSKVKLSVSTLKRLWRNDLQQLPHPATLDALVSILDIKDWHEFKKQHIAPQAAGESASVQRKSKSFIQSIPFLISLGVIALVIGIFVIQGFNKKDRVVVTKEVLFTADKTVTSGVPNTVEFHYDLSGAQADSFFIQQSWNPRDKVRIDPKKNYYSAIYYTPGFHLARIMANDSILKFQNVHIKTDGWLPMVKYELRDKKPIYLNAKTIEAGGLMRTTIENLQSANVEISRDFHLRYYNIRDFEGVDADNFDLETRFKCDTLSPEGRSRSIACPLMEVMIITEQDVFFVPVTTKGCIGELDLLVGEVYRSSKDNDLSAFGTDVYRWQVLRIRNENKKVSIFLNDLPIHELQYQDDFGKIKGIIYTFSGTGSVDFLRFRNIKGELAFADEFGPNGI